jgi:hypothetical protein
MRGQCPLCGREFSGRSDKIYCGPTCRSRNSLAPRANASPDPHLPPVEDHPLVVATRAELAAAGREGTALGAAAIALACAMCAPRVGNAALVAASKELSRTMKAALRGAPPVNVGSPKLAVVRPVNELTSRRTKRQKRGYGGPR